MNWDQCLSDCFSLTLDKWIQTFNGKQPKVNKRPEVLKEKKKKKEEEEEEEEEEEINR